MSNRTTRRSTALLTAVALCLLVGCTQEPDDGTASAVPSEPTSTASERSPEPEPTDDATDPEPTDEPTDEATASAAPATDPAGRAVLTADGVADVVNGTQDPEERLVALLGEPDERFTQEDYADCGGGETTALRWRDLTVEMNSGALYGWHATGADLPEEVAVPHDITVGEPVSTVHDAVPTAETEHVEQYDFYVTEFEGLVALTVSEDPASPIVLVGSAFMTCD